MNNTIPIYDDAEMWEMADLASSASNPIALAAALTATMRKVLSDCSDTEAVCNHPCVVAIFDQMQQIMRAHSAYGEIDAVDAWRKIRLHNEDDGNHNAYYYRHEDEGE